MSTNIEQLIFHYHSDNKVYNVKQKENLRWLHTGGQEIQSGINLNKPDALVLNYQKPLLGIEAFIQTPPKRILLLGMGGGSIAAYLQKRFPDSDLIIVDIEPLMLQIAEDYFFYERAKNTEFVFTDAYEYLKEADHNFDLILCDIFGMRSLPEMMLTPTFYKSIQHALSEKGMASINLVCESKEQYLILLNWARHPFNNQTITHGIPKSRNAIVYGFNDKNWETRFNHLVREKLLPDPLFSPATGAYLQEIPKDLLERLKC